MLNLHPTKPIHLILLCCTLFALFNFIVASPHGYEKDRVSNLKLNEMHVYDQPTLIITENWGGHNFLQMGKGQYGMPAKDVVVKCALAPSSIETESRAFDLLERAAMNTNINQDGSELIGKRVHQFAINHQISCLVLAYAGKETLHEYLFGLKPRVSSIASKLPRIIRQIMRGIAYMHRAGLVHGDVKSSNIIVSDDRRSSPIPKLTIIDFDLSRPVEANNNNRASFKTNSGTPSYLPPEAFLFDTIDGRKQDMWAIGATIYFLLRQRETYFGIKLRYMFEENIKELFTQHMKRVRDDNKTYLDPITDDMSEMQAWGPLIKVMNDCLAPRFENRPTPEEYVEEHRFMPTRSSTM